MGRWGGGTSYFSFNGSSPVTLTDPSRAATSMATNGATRIDERRSNATSGGLNRCRRKATWNPIISCSHNPRRAACPLPARGMNCPMSVGTQGSLSYVGVMPTCSKRRVLGKSP